MVNVRYSGNSTYGASKDKFNNLYDPLMANNVCITGQLLLVDLIEKLEEGLGDKASLIQANTDGILVKLHDKNDYSTYLDICKEWEERSLFELEHDIYTKVIQKDVNNYVIIDEHGSYKAKGAYVKKLNKIDYDLPIVNRALVNYLVDGIPIENTINNCDKLIEFQKISKITGLYRCALYKGIEMTDKVYRVFASRSTQDGTLYKIKGEDKVEKVSNTPDYCFIDNSNILDKKVPAKLDKQWYINLANKRLKDFIGGDKLDTIR